MKPDSLLRISSLLIALSWTPLHACGGSTIEEPVASTDFADVHREKLDFDCAQTIDCKRRSGETIGGGSDPQGQCLKMSNLMIGIDPALQMAFLTNYGRCSQLTSCDYRNCAMSGAHGWGETQRGAVTYDCQQKLSCSTSQGTFTGDAQAALDACVSESIGLLDSFSVERHTTYTQAYTRCASMTSCEFVSCFVY
jgi:hypothetical protein